MQLKPRTIFCRQRSIDKVAEQNLVILAVHFFQPLMHRAPLSNAGTRDGRGLKAIKGRLRHH
jgi:hypothetical protein